jgi:hypothetical protein
MTSNTKKSIQKTVNKVRETASQGYQDNVPILKDNNLASFKEAFFAYQPAINEFYVGLVNLFAKIIWNTDRFNHKLSFLKKGNYTIGYDIEEIHTNPVNPALYDNTDGAGILGDYPPEVLTAFYRENRHDVFPLTTNSEILSRAMDSWERLGNFINSTRIAVDNGNALREFNLLKQSIVGMYEKSGFVTREVDSSTDDGVADLMEQLRTDINDMQFLSSKFNKYKELSGGEKEAQSVSEKDNICIICTTKAEAKVRRYLSGVFNLQELEDANRFILVDDFGYDIYEKQGSARQLTITGHKTTPISFIVADKNFVQWYDRLNVEYEFKNGFTLNINTFVHIWQMISISPFANAVCYIDKTINKAVSTDPNETFNITAVSDTREYEFIDSSNEQVKLSSLDQLEIIYCDVLGKFSKTIPTAPLELSITDMGTLKITVNDQIKSDSWVIALIKFGDAVISAENRIAP